MNNAIKFLQSQRLLSIALADAFDPWIANLYFGASDKGDLFFVSPEGAKHSQMILVNPRVAFSSAWSDQNNPSNRKGVQGIGECQIVKRISEIVEGLSYIHRSVPGLRKLITLDWLKKNAFGSKLWVIHPKYLKYWDDGLYGEEESREFIVSRVPKHSSSARVDV